MKTQFILDCIEPDKDVDGCCTTNQQLLNSDSTDLNTIYIPCAALAMQAFLNISSSFLLLSFLYNYCYHIPIKGKHGVIIGKSTLVGLPCYSILRKQGCECDQCDINTRDIASVAQKADLLVSGVGKPGLIQNNWLQSGVSIIDIGTRCIKDCYGKCIDCWLIC